MALLEQQPPPDCRLPTNSSLHLRLSGKTFAATSLGLVTIALVDGLLPQMQMIATGGHILIPNALVKLLLIATLVVSSAWQIHWSDFDGFAAAWLFITAFLSLDCIFLLIHGENTLADVVTGVNSYYAYFLVAPIVGYLANELDERRVVVHLKCVFAVCFAIGAAQFLTQKPLIYTESSDGSFLALSWQSVDSGLRAFSLFSSGLGYGAFCSLIGALGIGSCFYSSSKVWSIILFLTAAVGCYTTTTRNCYLQFALAAVAATALSMKPLRRFIRYAPLLFLLVAVGVAWAGLAADSSSDSAITSNLSLVIRAAAWQYYANLYWNAPLIEKILGLGFLHNANPGIESLLSIDNQFLAILLNTGIVGLILLLWFHWKMWIRLYMRAIERPSGLTIAGAAFWSTSLAVYSYNISLATYSLVFILVYLANPAGPQQAGDRRATKWFLFRDSVDPTVLAPTHRSPGSSAPEPSSASSGSRPLSEPPAESGLAAPSSSLLRSYFHAAIR